MGRLAPAGAAAERGAVRVVQRPGPLKPLQTFSRTAESLKADNWNVPHRDPFNRILAAQVCNRELILAKGVPVFISFPDVRTQSQRHKDRHRSDAQKGESMPHQLRDSRAVVAVIRAALLFQCFHAMRSERTPSHFQNNPSWSGSVDGCGALSLECGSC